MPYKNKADRNTYERTRRSTNPEAARKARENSARFYSKNKEEIEAGRREHRKNNPEVHRGYEFKCEMKDYGTTTEWYLGRLIEQCGVCAICKHLSHHHGTIQRLQVDHNHDCCDTKAKSCGKCNRGLLCADCNIRLSYLEAILDETYMRMEAYDGTWLEKAIKYLDSYKGSA
jgi:hypothetical protein